MAEEKLKAVIEVEVDKASKARAEKELGGIGDKTSEGTKKATAGFEELRESMDKIRGMQFADMIVDNLDKIKETLAPVREGFKNAKEEFKLAGAVFREYLPGSESWKDMRQSGMSTFDILKDSMKTFKKDMSGVRSGLTYLKDGFKALGVAAKAALTSIIAQVAALIATIGGLIASMRNAITVAQQMKASFYEASTLGLSLTEYQKWQYILESVGESAEDLADAIKTLSSEQAILAEGSEGNAKAFEALGLSVDKVLSMTQEELFKETVKGLQNIEDSVKKTTLAYQIFGEDTAARLTNVLYMNNQEMEKLIDNFYTLGGVASDSLTKKSLVLSQALHNLRTAWTGLKNTLAEAVMPVVTAVVNWLTKAVAVVNMFTRAVFGLEIISGKSNAKGTNAAVSSVKNYAAGVKDATKAVEKLKRTTLGFDELNIVGNPNSGASADAGIGDMGMSTGAGAGFSLDGIATMSEEMSASLEKWREKIEKWKDTIRSLVPIALIGVGVIGGVLAAMSGNWILAIALFAMAGVGLYAMTQGEGGFQGYADAFSRACNGLLAPALIAAGAIGGVIALLTGNVPVAIALFATAGLGIALVSFSDGGWKSFIEKIKRLFSGFGSWFAEKWNKASADFKLGVLVVYDWITDKFEKAWNFIANTWNAAVKFFSNIWVGIKQVFSNVADWFREMFLRAWVGITMIWDAAAAYFQRVWTTIKIVFSVVASFFGDNFKAAWKAITDIFDKAAGYFSGIWDKIKKVFKDASGAIGSAVANAFSSAINWVLDKAISMINGFIRTLNKAIGVINKIPGVELSTLSEISIPKLAKGGIATASTIANIGEAGREAILPLDNNTGWMDALADKIAARNGGAPTQIVLTLDARELGKATIKSINDITKATGNLPLVLG